MIGSYIIIFNRDFLKIRMYLKHYSDWNLPNSFLVKP